MDKNKLNAIASEIAKNVNIVDIVGNYVDLRRKGKDSWGICPFHNDKDPSLCVSQEKQIFTCWSCHTTGNVFKFVEDIERISFIPALKKVCELGGIKVPAELESNAPVAINKYQRLNDLLNDLSKYYMLQLSTEDGVAAKKYLQSRNITNEDITTFKIGYAPEDGLRSIEFLHSKGYKDDEIVSCGIGLDDKRGGLIDRLKGRVIFSLTDAKGNAIGFSGRRLVENNDLAKYVNSPETVLFHKTNTLYNFKNAFDNAKCGFTYVVEGFMDAIALHKAGFKSVVATMGTAFTEDHIKLLRSLKTEIRLLFDSDEAGQTATARSLHLLRNSKLNLSVVKPLEGYKDVDEALNKGGKEVVEKLVNNLKTPIDWQLNHLSSLINFENHDDVKKYVSKAVELLADSQIDEMDKEYYFNTISSKSRISKQLINKYYDEAVRKIDSDFAESNQFNGYTIHNVEKALNRYEQASHQILIMMIKNPLNVAKYNSLGVSLCDKTCRQIAALIVDTYNKGIQITYPNLFLEATPEMSKVLGQLSNENYPDRELEDLANILKIDLNKKLSIDELKIQLEQEKDLEKQQEIARQIINIKRGK